MNNDYYVYIYWRLDINEPFYVGKGKGRRWKRLDEGARKNKYFQRIINKTTVVCEMIKENLTELESFYWEEEIIRQLVFEYGYSIDIPNNRSDEKGYHLVNCTWGGEGCSGLNPWENKSEEETKIIKKKISEKLKGENSYWYGKSFSDEHKKKLSENHWNCRGENSPCYGKPMTEEQKLKISEALKGRFIEKDNPTSKSIICLTTKRIFFSMKSGADYYKCNFKNISSCCKGKRKSCGVYNGQKLIWRYITWNHNKKYRPKSYRFSNK